MASCKLGASSGSAGGPSASSSSRLPPREGDNGMNRRQNGRLHSAAGEGFKSMNGDTAQSLRPSATRYSTTAEERQQHTSAGAEATISRFVDSKTSPFISLLFHRTLTQANLDKEVVKRLNIESLIRKLTPKDSKFIQETCDRYLEYVRNSQEVSIDSHLHDIETAGWDVTDNNVHIEFKKVVNETFDENVTWGGVIGFLGFALGFSIFVYNKGMKQTVVSVAEWTKQVIEEDIGSFFLTHNGWVSCNVLLLCRVFMLVRERERERERE